MPRELPRCEVEPQPDNQASFRIDGAERLRWHFGPSYPRPFFYPLVGPCRKVLTRMGHPGAPDHDHHRSIWFAHEKVLGINFWGDRTTAVIRQKGWLCYQDGPDEAAMAVSLGWFDGHDPRELLEQELIVGVRPGPEGETLVEMQSTFRPTAETLEFGKTNFGFLAVRVAKNVSEYFGGGRLTNSSGATGEAALFAKPAQWVDYSGAVMPGHVEGITYFDHPTNPSHPNPWHVREDGWMGCSPCLNGPVTTTRKDPLVLRYLLHAHRGPVSPETAARTLEAFAALKRYVVVKAAVKHTQNVIRRAE